MARHEEALIDGRVKSPLKLEIENILHMEPTAAAADEMLYKMHLCPS